MAQGRAFSVSQREVNSAPYRHLDLTSRFRRVKQQRKEVAGNSAVLSQLSNGRMPARKNMQLLHTRSLSERGTRSGPSQTITRPLSKKKGGFTLDRALSSDDPCQHPIFFLSFFFFFWSVALGLSDKLSEQSAAARPLPLQAAPASRADATRITTLYPPECTRLGPPPPPTLVGWRQTSAGAAQGESERVSLSQRASARAPEPRPLASGFI